LKQSQKPRHNAQPSCRQTRVWRQWVARIGARQIQIWEDEMTNYKKHGGKFVSYEFSKREITINMRQGGFEPLERHEVSEMFIGGYLPESPNDNPCFGYSINGEDTGFEWYWGDMPQSFRKKLWKSAE
jgi:hypothetical protein